MEPNVKISQQDPIPIVLSPDYSMTMSQTTTYGLRHQYTCVWYAPRQNFGWINQILQNREK